MPFLWTRGQPNRLKQRQILRGVFWKYEFSSNLLFNPKLECCWRHAWVSATFQLCYNITRLFVGGTNKDGLIEAIPCFCAVVDGSDRVVDEQHHKEAQSDDRIWKRKLDVVRPHQVLLHEEPYSGSHEDEIGRQEDTASETRQQIEERLTSLTQSGEQWHHFDGQQEAYRHQDKHDDTADELGQPALHRSCWCCSD